MIHYTRVIQGLVAFVQNDITGKLNGSWKAWALKVLVAMAASKGEALFHMVSSKPMATTIGLVDGENVNVEVIMAELRKQAQGSTATIDIPMIGAYTLDINDVEALNRYIRG